MDKTKFRSMLQGVLVLAVIALCSGLLLGFLMYLIWGRSLYQEMIL